MTDEDTNSKLWWIRVRKRLAELAPAVVVGLLVVGALGGWFVYQTHANPGVETEERVVATWNEHGTDSHAAEVTEPNPLFQEGQVLSDRPVYFTGVSPELRGAYTYSYNASDTGSLAVTLNATLRTQSVGDDVTYWAVTEPLQGTHVENVSPGETATVETLINVSQVTTEINRIQERVGATVGTTEAELVFNTRVAGSVNGQEVANTNRRTLVVDAEGSTYSVEPAEAFDVSHVSTERVESEQSYGLLRSYGSVILLLLSVLGLFGFAVASYQGQVQPSPTEQRILEQSQQREEFDDWISTGTVPTRDRPGTEIELDSLEDLVDVAIDTNERVIEDKDSGDFYVPGADRYFLYSPDPVENLRSRDAPEGNITMPDPSETDGEEGGTDSARDQRSGGSPSTDGGENTGWMQSFDLGEQSDDAEAEDANDGKGKDTDDGEGEDTDDGEGENADDCQTGAEDTDS